MQGRGEPNSCWCGTHSPLTIFHKAFGSDASAELGNDNPKAATAAHSRRMAGTGGLDAASGQAEQE
jgi:hypothetical protein